MLRRRAGGIVSLGRQENWITPRVSTSVRHPAAFIATVLTLVQSSKNSKSNCHSSRPWTCNVSPKLLNVRNPDLAVPGTIHSLLLRNLVPNLATGTYQSGQETSSLQTSLPS
jgi:hypothetical protein